MYRLPEASTYTILIQRNGNPLKLHSVADLTTQCGFAIAPFAISDHAPVRMIVHDEIVEKKISLHREVLDEQMPVPYDPTDKVKYESDFSKFHEAVSDGALRKVVLSRCTSIPHTHDIDPEELFLKACRIYPYQFIALVSIEDMGTWLMATPEVLLESDGDLWRTMALAGTMQSPALDASASHVIWSQKNLTEQAYVSGYIREVLSHYGQEISSEGPYTTRAAHLLHLKTDFSFQLANEVSVGQVLEALHPTPAVCGIPKAEAKAFIEANESVKRNYYSGFCGPLHVAHETHLYVSLRCMEITAAACRLYAGGGILADSQVESEWAETQSKMKTMWRLLQS